jgi:hypothetical protein
MNHRLHFAAVVILATLCGCEQRDIPLSERYPGPWREEFHAGITKALASKSIGGCGQYKHRESSKDRNEFLVYCTGDGSLWTAYLVWPNTGGVVGPNAPDPALQ